jgi:murein DD-endopeptidase MepM/ murein hydrolase activator NlpD
VVEYSAQSGDTLAAVAAHFNTSVEEILSANPEVSPTITTFPAGFPLQVPAYYLPLTGSPFQILPDSEVVNSPSAAGFDLQAEITRRPGYLANLSDYAYRIERPAWEVVGVVATNYSLHPRLLLALLEYTTGALSMPFPEGDREAYPLGMHDSGYRGLFRQLMWVSERLSDGYYGWRSGSLREFETADGRLYRPDSWQNAGTVAIQYALAGLYGGAELERAIGPEGFSATYRTLWGDPFANPLELVPGNLQQPELALPFEPGHIWDFTGGPHFSWGTSLPLGALDFAPPSAQGGCVNSQEWATAPAAGVIARSGEAAVVLDLDGDGDERTGWTLFFFHIAEQGRIAAGTQVEVGTLLGRPSCEGGRSTGTHFHLARRYNGEWLPAAGVVPFTLDGWVAAQGEQPYQGTLTKGSQVVSACTCSTQQNRIFYRLPQP